MFCENCGKQIPDGESFCPYCGGGSVPTQAPAQAIVTEKAPMDYAAVSLVLGIVGLLCSSCCMPILNIIGIIFGVKANKFTGRKAGLILNIIGLILSLLWVIVLWIWFAAVGYEVIDELMYLY